MEGELLLVTDFNIDIAFKVAWASFMKIDQLIYITVKVEKSIFAEISLTKSDIFFAKGNYMQPYMSKRA